MDLDISRHVAECQVCQQTTEKGVPNQQGPDSLLQTKRPNQRIHNDLFGSIMARDGKKKFILVATDTFTKIVRLSIIKDKTATTVANAILEDWIFVYGVPSNIILDGGREFANDLQKTLWRS